MCIFFLKSTFLHNLFHLFYYNCIPNIFEKMLKTFQIAIYTYKFLHKHRHTYTPSHHHNNPLFTTQTLHAHFQNTPVHKQSIKLPTFLHANTNIYQTSVHINYTDYKYSTAYKSVFSIRFYTGKFGHTYLFFPLPNLLLFIQPNYPSCNPKSYEFIFNG